MEIKVYVDFDRETVLSEKEFKAKKEETVQDLANDTELFKEFLEYEFEFMENLFFSLKNGTTTIEQILEEYELWIYEGLETPFRFSTELDEFREFRLEV